MFELLKNSLLIANPEIFFPSQYMRETQSHRIGIFDSGVGGLTVLRELYRQLPNESILYFADRARLPYGTRSRSEILQFVREIMTWMSDQQVKMIIMACNTGSALALETVRYEYDLPILGVVLPGARAAVEQGKRIGVIATPATVASNTYTQAIQEIDSTARVWEVACPELVPLIEQNQINTNYTREIVKQYLQPLLQKKINTLIYGCTHYRHLENIIREIVPASVNLVDPAQYVVKAAEQELEIMGLKNNLTALPTRFCVSDSPETFASLSQQWLGCTPVVEKVYLQKEETASLPLDTVE